ncbi:permease [Mycobacterium sp. PDNC021]|uniref:permease n=1 Tax=Mycobacterium sp. PDNC021 TaxID=3391399 RepID=UPI003AAEB6E4
MTPDGEQSSGLRRQPTAIAGTRRSAGHQHGHTATVRRTTLQRWVGSAPFVVAVFLVLAVAARPLRNYLTGHSEVSTAATVFCGVFVQALPFLALGVVVSGLIAAFVSAEKLARWLPKRAGPAILAAGLGGMALPGCECGSVPIARRLFSDGVTGAAALTFLLAAPAINPVVLVATAVAFPGHPDMVVGRGIGSLLTALIMGAIWSRWGNLAWVTRRLPATLDADASRWRAFVEAARSDFLQAASYLVIGAALAAALHVVVPAWVFERLTSTLALGIVVMAVLAVVLALCSEADAFVASSMSMMPLLPRLVFLVVGPAVDVKLFAMQAGMFGRAFALRFAPATFVVATVVATVVGSLVLGTGA